MKTLQLSEEKAKELYKNASPEFRAMLEETFGEPFFQSIDTVEDAQKYLGLTNNCYLYINKKHFDRLKAFYHLSILCDAYNKQDGFVPDLNDPKQVKWYPLFSNKGYDYSFSYPLRSVLFANFGHQFCFKSEQRSEEFGKKYEYLFKIFFKG